MASRPKAPRATVPGTCPDCGEESFIRRGKLLGAEDKKSWVVPRDLLQQIRQGLIDSFRIEILDEVSSRDPATGITRVYQPVQKFFCCSLCRVKSATLTWVDLQSPLVGPFCSRDLPGVLDRYAVGPQGRTQNVQLYIVRTSDKDVISLAEEGKAAANGDASNVSDTSDLFEHF